MTSLSFLELEQCKTTAPALVADDGRTLSYAELAERVEAAMGELGTERRLIVIEMGPDVESVVFYLAALKARHPAILVQPGYARLNEIVETFAPRLIVRRGRIERIGRGPGPELHADLALLMVTSGSTGGGRLVRLSRGNLASNADAIAEALSLATEDRAALTLPLHYSYGLSILNSHLAIGASVKLVKTPVLDPGFVPALDGCTNLSGVPYSYELYERIGLRDRAPLSLRMMTAAGGRLDPRLVRAYGAFMASRGGRFLAMYGQTEATARIAVLPAERAATHPDEIGHAIPGGTLDLVDGDGALIAGEKKAGELIYRGPNVMMGYAAAMTDLARGPEIDRLATGDLAERTASGSFRITGRKSRFSKISGVRVGHEEAERALALQGIAATVVGDDRILVAAVRTTDEEEPARKALSALTGLPLGRAESLCVPVLPRLPSGKTDLAALTELAVRDAGHAPSGVLSAFQETFYPRPVRTSDSFVSLGGDSLAFVQLSLALERLIGHAPEGWEHQPIGRLLARHAPRRWTKIDTDLALRGPAILFVVLHHATQGPYVGGAAVMLLLAGYSLARFQSAGLFAGRSAPLLGTLAKNLIPYFCVLALCAAIEGGVPWQKWLLLGNLGIGGYSPTGTFHVIYWFVEAYAQIVAAVALLFLLPAVRRAVALNPLGWGLALLAVALLSRAAIREAWAGDPLRVFTTPAVLYVFVFGWCLYFARSWRWKIALTAVALVMFPMADPPIYNFLWIKLSVALSACMLLLWLPRIPLPKRAMMPILVLGAASYHIYLVHNLLPHFLFAGMTMPRWAEMIINFSSGILLGLVVYGLQRGLVRFARRWRTAHPPRRRLSQVPAE